ncbi:MAG: sulfite exporter TauE/SafE family protein [Rhodospirillaceae bacterium]|jgi:uncharacterized protein|nr:sulfite exporter TauE/SafE family protein [Rhodospirillaceae bacterium]MBT6137131.1 sulfite exporter TauE/SafE family protein [Rhodospirillaceae bacterium]
MLELLPEGVLLWAAGTLVAVSYFTSAFTAAFGIGGGLFMLVSIASLVPPLAIIPLHGLVQIGSNAGRAAVMRQHISYRPFALLTIGGVVGVVIASQIVVALPQSWLRLILGVFVVWAVWGPKPKSASIGDLGYAIAGAAASFATMFVGATGPLIAAFISPDRFSKNATVATHAATMTLQHTLKIIAFGVLGFAFMDWLPLVAAMIATGFLGTLTGRYMLERIPEIWFKRIFKTALTLLAARLIIVAVMGLLGY